jgi:Leucine-rich repeat (LRR) protein
MNTPPGARYALSSLQPITVDQLQKQFDDDPVLNLIQKQLSSVLADAAASDLEAYRQARIISHHAHADVRAVLKQITPLRDFALPLLQSALDKRFGPGLDAEAATLYRWYPPGFLEDAWSTEYILLESALHNFEREEDFSWPTRSRINPKNSIDNQQALNPEEFSDLCRHLNLGRKYQDHLEGILQPDSPEGSAAHAARDHLRSKLIWKDRTDMELYAHVALLKKHISRDALNAILALTTRQADPQFNGKAIRIEKISVMGFGIPRALVIQPQETWTVTQRPLVLYIPGDPITAFQEFVSWSALEDALRIRLFSRVGKGSYISDFFVHLVGERSRAQLLRELLRHLFPHSAVGNVLVTHLRNGPWIHERDFKANLRLESDSAQGELFKGMFDQQLQLLYDNARFHAVPTEYEDAKSREKRLQNWLSAGMSVANFLAFFPIPVFSQLMLLYSASELLGEVYHGMEDLSHGDLEQGLDHLLGVAANIAALAAAGKTLHGPTPSAITRNNFVGELVPVTLSSGETRLWKPNAEPFRSSIRIPETATADLDGVFEIKGKHYVRIEADTYEVAHQQHLNKWQLRHPDPAHPHSPTLEHNGAGAFRHAWETPAEWGRNTMFRRLGHSVSGLGETAAEQILAVTGTSDASLRQLHAQGAMPAGQLSDTIKRFSLDSTLESFVEQSGNTRAQEFERRYAASESAENDAVQRLKRDFPSLPVAVADELLATSFPAEIEYMTTTGRLPLRLAEAAAWQTRQTRLNRALEGFYLKSSNSPDTETLTLRLLDRLSGWSDQVRLEVRQGSTSGALLTTLGDPQAMEFKTLVKSNGRYQAFDANGNDLNGSGREGNNLFPSILHALPDAARASIGLPHVWQAPELKLKLGELATQDRERASALLGQRRDKLQFNSPTRLKDGRIGYALSGRGRLQAVVLEDHLLDKLGLLELRNTFPAAVLEHMRANGLSLTDINARLDVLIDERSALRASLAQWADQTSERLDMTALVVQSRMRIHDAILDFWEASSFASNPESHVLRLRDVVLAEFPTQLPASFNAQVRRLQLSNVMATLVRPLAGGVSMNQDILGNLLASFPETTDLEISNTAASRFYFAQFSELPDVISSRLPRLSSLSLVNQSLYIDAQTLNTFGRMSDLQVLDLSGNRLLISPQDRGSIRLSLRRLVLNNVGLRQWPEGLAELIPAHIGELSLDSNQISSWPTPAQPEAPSSGYTLISLHDNLISNADMIEVSLRSVEPRSAMRIDPGLSPELQQQVDTLLSEQAELSRVIANWVQGPESGASVSEPARNARQRLGTELLDHWRNVVVGRNSPPYRIESMVLADFPQALPETFYRSVTDLRLLNVTANAEELNRFIGHYRALTTLHIDGPVESLIAPPPALAELTALRSLSLTGQGLLIDQNAMEFFSRMESLRHLNLGHNQLGEITFNDVLNRQWHSLRFEHMGINSWPQWLSEYLPNSVDELFLSGNQLTELPEHILSNPSSYNGYAEIVLHGNPLSETCMQRAHMSEFGRNRTYTFYMDLPEHIDNLRPGPLESSSDEEVSDSDNGDDAIFHSHGPVVADAPVAAGVEDWLSGTAEQNVTNRAIWDQVVAAGDAPMLLSLIGELRRTADFKRARAVLTQRVWCVLAAAAKDQELRVLLNVDAQDAVANLTCGDGVRLQFNQMELRVLAKDTQLDIQGPERGPSHYRHARRLYRCDEVDALAVANAGERDQAEVRLAYRLRLAQVLDLPLAPSVMLYGVTSGVTPNELEEVLTTVINRQAGDAFVDNAVRQALWNDWLNEAYPQEFVELNETFASRQERLEDEFPEFNAAYSARVTALNEERTTQELELRKALTRRERQKYGD